MIKIKITFFTRKENLIIYLHPGIGICLTIHIFLALLHHRFGHINNVNLPN